LRNYQFLHPPFTSYSTGPYTLIIDAIVNLVKGKNLVEKGVIFDNNVYSARIFLF